MLMFSLKKMDISPFIIKRILIIILYQFFFLLSIELKGGIKESKAENKIFLQYDAVCIKQRKHVQKVIDSQRDTVVQQSQGKRRWSLDAGDSSLSPFFSSFKALLSQLKKQIYLKSSPSIISINLKQNKEKKKKKMGTLGKTIYTVGFWIRETGQALDRLGCRLQGNYYFQEQRAYPKTLISPRSIS